MDTCTKHRFPRSAMVESLRSRGGLIIHVCNNCNAVQVTQRLDVPDGTGGWSEVTQTTVVGEPSQDGTGADSVVRYDKRGNVVTE